MINPDVFRRDGIVFPAGRIDVAGFAEGYGRFQADSLRLRGRETYLKPHLVSAWLDEVVRRPAIVDLYADGVRTTAAGMLALEAALRYPSGFGEAKRAR